MQISGTEKWRRRRHGAGSVRQVEASQSPSMLTTDLSLRLDPAYEKISRRFYEHPDQFADAFAKAWYKLTHRDMGPRSRYLGPLVPKEPQTMARPVPAVDHELIGERDIAALKGEILKSGLSISQLVATAWASAATFRGIRQARWSERGPHSPCAAKGLGSEPAGRTGEGSAGTRRRSKRSSTLHSLAGRRFRSPT